jgi:hypothetical protein
MARFANQHTMGSDNVTIQTERGTASPGTNTNSPWCMTM